MFNGVEDTTVPFIASEFSYLMLWPIYFLSHMMKTGVEIQLKH